MRGVGGSRARWAAAAAVVVVLVGVWYVVQSTRSRPSAIPGPLGGPEVAVDVNTMLGMKGHAFVLRDGDGAEHRVTPGATGRPLVVISHMGYY